MDPVRAAAGLRHARAINYLIGSGTNALVHEHRLRAPLLRRAPLRVVYRSSASRPSARVDGRAPSATRETLMGIDGGDMGSGQPSASTRGRFDDDVAR